MEFVKIKQEELEFTDYNISTELDLEIKQEQVDFDDNNYQYDGRENEEEIKQEEVDIDDSNYQYDGREHEKETKQKEVIDIKYGTVYKVSNNFEYKKPMRYDSDTEYEEEEDDKSDSTLLRCVLCKFTTENMFFMKNHLLSCNKTIPKIFFLKCEHCHFRSRWQGFMNRHNLLEHSKEFKCNFCEFSSRNKYHHSKHMLIHIKKNLYKCHHCENSYSTNDALREHLKQNIFFRCDRCKYTCSTMGHMKKHQQNHSKNDKS